MGASVLKIKLTELKLTHLFYLISASMKVLKLEKNVQRVVLFDDIIYVYLDLVS